MVVCLHDLQVLVLASELLGDGDLEQLELLDSEDNVSFKSYEVL